MPVIQDRPKALKYWTLVEHLRDQVLQNVLQPGDRVPSLVEMQEQFRVSRGTVEKAYTLLEQEGLLVRTQGSGTFVMTPPSKPNYTIAISPQLMPNDRDLYWFMLLKGINLYAQQNSVEVIYASDYGSVWERAKGMIVSDGPLDSLGKYPMGYPFVSLVSVTPGAYCVVADDHSGMYQLTRSLLEKGHRKIALLYAYKPGSAITTARYEGHKTAIREAGIEYIPKFVRVHEPVVKEVDFMRDAHEIAHVEAGYLGMKQWLEEDWFSLGCTAVMAYNDAMAIGIMRALQESGLRVPEDVSVTGFDGTPAFDYVSPRLTTAYIPLNDIGYTGMDIMVQRLQGRLDLPHITQLPVSIIQGDSVAVINS